MKTIHKKIGYASFLLPLLIGGLALNPQNVCGETNDLNGSGKITFDGEIPKQPVDPEDPSKPVDPGPGPSTDGPLRFDFVSTFNLGSNKITAGNRNYYVNAQLFHDGTPARGNYIQITDQRPESKGWTLQVRQETQFKNDVIQNQEEKELRGAVFSFDYGWANSAFTAETAPNIEKDIIEINEIGATYNVATANPGSGKGTWTIEFGASETNQNGQPNTLFKKTDANGNAILDSTFENQEVYGNKAIFLTVPEATKIYPVQYQTELTWILAELPN